MQHNMSDIESKRIIFQHLMGVFLNIAQKSGFEHICDQNQYVIFDQDSLCFNLMLIRKDD
jgi:hypothetical protein